MQRLFFVTGDAGFSGYATADTPDTWYFCPATDTQTAYTQFTQGNWSAVFVYWGNPTGTTGNFDATQFINQIRQFTGNPNFPVFLIVPENFTSQAQSWQTTANATGYVTWTPSNWYQFTQQVQGIINRYQFAA